MASRAVALAAVSTAPAAEPGRTHRVQRAALKISDPNDAAEREAESTARRVMTMPNPAIAPRERVSLLAARAPAVRAQPKAKANETAPEVTEAIKAERGGGSNLSAKSRAFMEPRFKASFAGVRIHTGKAAADLNEKLGARAFAFGRDIFFSPGAYQPDTPAGQELLAHELTHTIQQREVVQRDATVQERATPHVQRGLLGALSDAAGAIANAAGAALDAAIKVVKDFVADKAGILPGFKLLTLIIGKNPINDQPVSGGGAAILREIVGFIPFGDKIVEAFNNHGIFEKGGAFVDTQFKALRHLGGTLISGVKSVFSKIGLGDATNPGGVWDRITGFFSTAFGAIKDFGVGLVSGVVTLVRETIIPPLGRWAAANIPKWDLLMAVLGKNPVSEEGESPASQIIGAFMNLIGQGEIWENIKKGNAVNRAWQWFQTALKGAKSLVSGLPGQVMATLASFTIMDVLTIAGAFKKLLTLFGSFVGQFGSWAGGTILSLLEIILSVVAPTVVPYLKKAGGAFNTIIKNPAGFVRTLVAAGKLGFSQFASHFLTHLKASLVSWLTGSLGGAGVYIPQGFSVLEILKFVLSVLGLTWANIRAKLVAATNETTVKALETGFDIVKTLVTDGPAAAWKKIVETLTNLKQMAIDAIMDFVKSKVVEAAVTKLLSMLSPAGAFIQAIIAIYNTIMFFVERIRTIAQVAASFIDGIAAIAAGNIAPAANRVEQTMAGLLTLVISFLARIAGLGKVSDAVLGLINKVRAPVMKALDAVVAWIVATARKLGRFVAQAGVPQDPNERLKLAGKHAVTLAKPLAGKATKPLLAGALGLLKTRYALTSISPFEQGGEWFVTLSINPSIKPKLGITGTGATPTPTSSMTAVTPVDRGSWILKSGAYEQVTVSVSAYRRSPDGKQTPVSFQTANPSGGGGSLAYSGEGTAWTRTTFVHPSKLIIPIGGGNFKLQPARDREHIRTVFYGDTDSSRKAMVARKRPALINPLNPAEFLSEGDPAREAAMGYTKKDVATGRALVPVGVASPDHNPAIAVHWNNLGSKNNHAFRTGWNTNPATFKIMSLKLNLSLGSGGVTYQQDVSINFRGPGE